MSAVKGASGREGAGAGARRAPGLGGRTELAAGPAPAGQALSVGPPGVNLRAVTASLIRSPLLPPLHRHSPGEPEIGRASEPARESVRREGARGRPGSLYPAARPSCCHRSAPAPLTLGKLRTALGPRAAPLGGGPASRGGGEGGGRGGSEPEGSARSCLSNCFYLHPEQHSQKGAEPGWLALGANFQLFSQLVSSRHPGVPSGRSGGLAPASNP